MTLHTLQREVWLPQPIGRARSFGPLGSLMHRILVWRDLRAIFDYPAERMKSLNSER